MRRSGLRYRRRSFAGAQDDKNLGGSQEVNQEQEVDQELEAKRTPAAESLCFIWNSLIHSAGQKPAVDCENLAGHEACGVRGEKYGGAC
jgi:hypothetical protein